MQLYVRDWLASTYGMPLEVKGLHIDLLCIAWDNGALPDDAKWRQRVAGVSAPKAAALWAALRNRWRKTRKGWINPRQERQRRALDEYRAHAQHASSTRWASIEHQSGMASSIHRASPRTMPNRSTSSSSSSSPSEDLKPAAPVPFRVYAAIAKQAVTETLTDDLGDVAEAFKKKCAAQGLPYDASLTSRALNTATRKRA